MFTFDLLNDAVMSQIAALNMWPVARTRTTKYYSPFLACSLQQTQLNVIFKTTWFHKTHFWRKRKKHASKHTVYFKLDLLFPQELLASI
jgi:hypothetical protein